MGQFEALVGVNFWTALFVLLNTLAIFFVAKKYLTGPVMKIIAQRQKEIDDAYGEAEAARTDAQALEAEYRQRLTQAKSEAGEIIKAAGVTAATQAEQLVDEAQKEVASIKRRAEEDIEAQRRMAAGQLKSDISALALALAGKVMEKELDDGTQKELIDSFIDNMGDLSLPRPRGSTPPPCTSSPGRKTRWRRSGRVSLWPARPWETRRSMSSSCKTPPCPRPSGWSCWTRPFGTPCPATC